MVCKCESKCVVCKCTSYIEDAIRDGELYEELEERLCEK